MKPVPIARSIVCAAVSALLAPGVGFADYSPQQCRQVMGTLDIAWEAVAGPGSPCTGIEFTDGSLEDAADGSISVSGVSVSNAGCIGAYAYAFTLSKDGRTLTGSDTINDVPMVLTRGPGEGCFHGHWVDDGYDYVAHVAGDVFAAAAPPICGDVNDSGAVNTTDALMVLRKAVGQNVTVPCSRYGNIKDDCEFALSTTNADLISCESAPVCGDGVIAAGEDCEIGDLNLETCGTLGFAGGTLACAAGCTFDTSGCYAQRFDASGATILDRQTGLEWEKKTTNAGSGANYADPHDVDNVYTWSSVSPAADGTAFSDFLAKLNGVSDAQCHLGHCDWRLPTIEELQGIAVEGCALAPCVIDPAFLPTQPDLYWSSTSYLLVPPHVGAQAVTFSTGGSVVPGKESSRYVRAVRGGS